MIFVYCERVSEGANLLVQEINSQGYWAKRARREILGLRKGDLLINWGDSYPFPLNESTALNQAGPLDKYRELIKLREGGVRAPECCPPPMDSPGWLSRRSNHQGGSDLLRPGRADYYVKKYDFTKEFRVHVCKIGEDYLSIRTGIKVPRDGFPNPHPWIRSFDAGWRLDYGSACQVAIRQNIREEAKKAVRALGLDFGAVDVATLADGSPMVLEVNRAPGNEGNTTKCYATKFISLSNAVMESID